MPLQVERLAAGLADTSFEYQGERCNITYRTKALTKEFKAQALRLTRESARIQARSDALMSQITLVSAEEGSPEAKAEEAAASRAIQQLLTDDDTTKKALDQMILALIDKWDVLNADGSMYALTEENVYKLPSDFEAQIIQAVSEHSNLGERSASSSLQTSPSPLKPGEPLAILPPSLNSGDILPPPNGALQ